MLSMLLLPFAGMFRPGSGVRAVTFRQFCMARWAVWTHQCLVALVALNCWQMALRWLMTSFNR